jgi:hypothetical protein
VDSSSLAQEVLGALGRVLSGALTGAAETAGDQLYGAVLRHFRAHSAGGTFESFESSPTSPQTRDAFVQSLNLQLAEDGDFRERVRTLVSMVTAQDSSVRSVVTADRGSTAVGRDYNQTTTNSKKKTNYGGLVVAFVAIVVIGLILFIGRKVYVAVDNAASSAAGLNGGSTCADYLASADDQDKARTMKKLYLAANKPQLAGDPFILQNTDYFCSSSPKTTLAHLAEVRSNG